MWFTPLLQGAAQQQAATATAVPAVFRQSVPWTRQPQGPVEIDWSNPLTRGLIGLWCPPMGQRNLVSGVRLTPGPTVPVIGVNRPGRAFESSGQTITGNRSQYFTTGVTANPSALSMLCVFESFDAPSSSSAFGQPFGRDQYAFNFHHSDPAYRGAFTLHIGGYPKVLYPAMSANTVYTLAGTWDGANMRAWQNGVFSGQAAASGTLDTNAAAPLTILGGHNLSGAAFNGRFYIGGLWNRALTPSEIAALSANPWQIFRPVTRTIGTAVISNVTVYRPTGDILTTGWSASSGGSLFDMIDETVASDADWITSPALGASPGPATFSISSAPAGTYTVSIRARETAPDGQVRVVMKDAGGVSVGASAWQALDLSFITYSLSVTTTGTATQLSIEVQQ